MQPKRRDSRAGRACWSSIAAVLVPIVCFFAAFSALADQNPDPPELLTRETQPTFKLEVQRNLVVVRAVVRDAKGRPVPNLRKEDFRVFDNGKAQAITQFGLETLSSGRAKEPEASQRQLDAEALPETATAPFTPQRYLALYFDDVHLPFGELARTRDAGERYVAAAIQPIDRVAIFTASGEVTLDFTADLRKIQESLLRLRPRPIAPREQDPCPEIFEYQAYKIVHEHDAYALAAATEEAVHCRYRDDETFQDVAEADAEGEAVRVLNFSEQEAEYALRGLDHLVRRLAALPGQRNIVLVSPGFLTMTQQYRTNEVVDRALRSAVVINTLDARGLYVPLPLGDASQRPVVVARRPDLMGHKAQIQIEAMSRVADPLRDLAYDTGGEFFHNSNDFDEGFRKVGALPEAYYVLAFSPQNLKFDGRFHSLRVSVPAGLTVQARRGYFTPKERSDATAQAKEEIEQAVFSHDEVKELPVEVHTQFFKLQEGDAKLSILTHVDLHLLHFRKGDGRNRNNLTFVTALFDRDGKYLTGKEKLVEFRLLDGSLEKLLESGVTTKTSFEVKPGTYLVRQVVRDAEGGQLAGLNRTVEIPF